MDLFSLLISWQFVLIALVIAGIVGAIRSAFETLDPELYKRNWWKDIVLPTMPSIIGALGCWAIADFPFPNGLSTISGRILFGIVAGLFSGNVYRVIKKVFWQKEEANNG